MKQNLHSFLSQIPDKRRAFCEVSTRAQNLLSVLKVLCKVMFVISL